MNIAPFKVEEWMNEYEDGAKYNIAETCVDSVSIDQLFDLTGGDKAAFMDKLCARRLTYGDILGAPAFKEGICGLFKTIKPENIVTTHGAAGANHHVYYSLVSPGDRVISVAPTYQQLYSIPASMGAKVDILHLEKKDGFLPDLDKLEKMAEGGVKIIAINNPNNPSGALMDEKMLRDIAAIAQKHGAYLFCDEVYRGLNQKDEYIPSIADIYEKGISTGSMSKVFSMAGLRLGWIVSRDKDFIASCLSHRDYNHISCGMLDEALAAEALGNAGKLLERSRGIVRNNLAILDGWVGSHEGVSYVKPKAGTTALIYYGVDMDSYEFSKRLYHETGALVTPGDCFEEPGCVRVGYACKESELREGLAVMGDFIEKLKKAGN